MEGRVLILYLQEPFIINQILCGGLMIVIYLTLLFLVEPLLLRLSRAGSFSFALMQKKQKIKAVEESGNLLCMNVNIQSILSISHLIWTSNKIDNNHSPSPQEMVLAYPSRCFFYDFEIWPDSWLYFGEPIRTP
jgi:hypothetical protein